MFQFLLWWISTTSLAEIFSGGVMDAEHPRRSALSRVQLGELARDFAPLLHGDLELGQVQRREELVDLAVLVSGADFLPQCRRRERTRRWPVLPRRAPPPSGLLRPCKAF